MLYSKEAKKQLIKDMELYRFKNKLTQVDMAKLLGVTVTTLAGWEHETQLPQGIHCYTIESFLKENVK